MACSSFLNFEPSESPSSRKIQDEEKYILMVSEMIKDILGYERIWKEIENENIEQCSAVKREMYVDFLYQMQIGEKYISVNDRTNLKEILSRVINEASSQDSLQRIVDAVDEPIRGVVTKTINLLLGYLHLETLVDEESNNSRIIEVDECIKKCHKILMKDVMDKDVTVPGKFSVSERHANFNETKLYYPLYKTEDIAHIAVQTIVDQYNNMIEEISNDNNEMIEEISQDERDINKLQNSFKCASVLLFSFLMLHPFSDGNGRLARLLCNHCLNMFSPFPTAIYNVFSPSTREEYLTAIVKATKDLQLSSGQSKQLEYSSQATEKALLILKQKPADLCYLIIESNWFTWRRFLQKMGQNIQKLDPLRICCHLLVVVVGGVASSSNL